MSLGIVFKGPEGIVLAADSRVTLTAALPGSDPPLAINATYDNATKLLQVTKQNYIGAVTYGAGAIGMREPRTAHSYVPEFTESLGDERLSVLDFCVRFSEFFLSKWNASDMPVPYAGPDMIFLVGGFDEGEAYGKTFEIKIPSRPDPIKQNAGIFGLTWGGQGEYSARLLNGFDQQVPTIVQTALGCDDTQKAEVTRQLREGLAAPIPYQFLPLQDCVDLSIFLIRATIAIQRRIVGVRGVGGAIDVATITATAGLKFIQQKSILGEDADSRDR